MLYDPDSGFVVGLTLHLKSCDGHLKRTMSACVNPQLNFSVWPAQKYLWCYRSVFLLSACLLGWSEVESKNSSYQSYHETKLHVSFRYVDMVAGVNLRKFMTAEVIVIVVIILSYMCCVTCYSFMPCLHWYFSTSLPHGLYAIICSDLLSTHFPIYSCMLFPVSNFVYTC
jgi:hypothetical protein